MIAPYSRMKKLVLIAALSFAISGPLWARGGNNQSENDQKQTIEKHDKESLRKDQGGAVMALDQRGFEYMRNNVISTIYHEMAHALIDQMDLPVYGQEEDAADVFSVVMVEALYPEQEALRIDRGAALGFRYDHDKRIKKGREWDWADEHGPDMQRYFNIVCLAYGANPEGREGFAKDMELPDYRAEFCKDEYELAKRAWQPVIDRLHATGNGREIRFRHSGRSALQIKAAALIEQEVKAFNRNFRFPENLRITVKLCGEEKTLYAFYAADRKKITICTNYIDELYRDGQK